MTAEYTYVRDYRDAGMPDPTTHAELADGVLWAAPCAGARCVEYPNGADDRSDNPADGGPPRH